MIVLAKRYLFSYYFPFERGIVCFMKQQNQNTRSEKFMRFLFHFHQNFFRQTILPLPVNHFAALVMLDDKKALTISTLSEKLAISKQQMSPIIDKLVKSGYVAKNTLPNDHRCINISLTQEGKTLLEKNRKAHQSRLEKNLAVLSADELSDFDITLNHMDKLFAKVFPQK